MNIKINLFNDRNIACRNPLKLDKITLSYPKDDTLEIINNFLINDSIDIKSTQKKHL
ncbi:MAG: hypothetical protein ACRC6T_06135 [Sarcina sp.]